MDSGRQLGEYLLTVVVSYLINLGAFSLFLAYLKIGVVLAGILAVPLSTLVVFVILNYRVFRMH